MSAPALSFAERAESVRMIRDSAAAVVTPGDLARIRALRFTKPGFDPAILKEMGAMGWIGLRIPEEKGGVGLGVSESIALHEELGRGLVPEPLIAQALAASLLASSDGTDDLLARVLAGEAYVAVAWQESADAIHAPGSQAMRLFVPMASGASQCLVPMIEAGRTALFCVDASSLSFELVETQDGGHFGNTSVASAEARRISPDIGEALACALDEAALATSAYLLGLSEACFAITLDYMRTRHQFGKALGSFQALQHRLADIKIQLALSRASLEAAAAEIDGGAGPERRALAVSRAKARLCHAALLTTREAVQLHGAIGYTDECDIGLYLRKAMVMLNQFGSAGLHRARFMAMGGGAL